MMRTSSILVITVVHAAAAAWVNIDTLHAPSPRTSGAMATTEAGVLLFGGTDGESSSSFKNDTWIFDGQDWIEQHPTVAPTPRAIGQLATFGKGAVLFGGLSGLGTFEALNDTWTWTPDAGWRELQLSVAPAARAYHSMQTTQYGVVLFGGRTFHLDTYEESFNDVWLFDGESWTEITYNTLAPRPAARYAMAFAPVENGLLMFGGAGATENDHLSDTWLLRVNGSSTGDFVWEELQNYPAPRGRWCMNAASCGAGALITGGSVDYRMSSNETWRWRPKVLSSVWGTAHDSLGEWELVDRAPIANSGYASVAYSLNGQSGMLLWGGNFAPSSDPTQMAFTNKTLFWSCGATPVAPPVSQKTFVNINLYTDGTCGALNYTESFEVGRCYDMGTVHLKYELEGECSRMREIRYSDEGCSTEIGSEDTMPHTCYNFTLQNFRSFQKHCSVGMQNGVTSITSSTFSSA